MTEATLNRSVWDIDADDFPTDGSIEEQARFLLRYAILAPSSHNSQPWAFEVRDDEIRIAADESRWLDAADPDKRELYISVGCAIENCCVAAEGFGFDPQVEYHDSESADFTATVALRDDEPTNPRQAELFDELTTRATSHAVFEDRPLGTETRERLEGVAHETDITLHLVDAPEMNGAIGALQAEADRLQMDDPEYRAELGHWIGNGALGSSWLAARIGQSVVTHLDIGDREAKKNSKLIQSAPVVAVLTTETNAPVARVRTGQTFERMALVASSDSVAIHPMSQTLERPEMRACLADTLGTTESPQHLFRLGFTDKEVDHTPRWPLEVFMLGSEDHD